MPSRRNMIAMTDEEAKEVYPDGWKTVKPYLRVVPQPD